MGLPIADAFGYSTDVTLNTGEIREKYEAIAPEFDRLEALVERLGIRSLRRSLFSQAEGRVLEIAIGTGKNIPVYGDRVRHLVGVDLSPAMLAHARERARQAAFPVELREGDAMDLPFAAGSFDTVTSSLSTCTFPDPVAALREMRRVVASHGRILLLEHGRSSRPWLGRFQDWRAEAHARRLGCRWNQEPRSLVEAAGLRVITGRRAFFGIFHLLEVRPAQ